MAVWIWVRTVHGVFGWIEVLIFKQKSHLEASAPFWYIHWFTMMKSGTEILQIRGFQAISKATYVASGRYVVGREAMRKYLD